MKGQSPPILQKSIDSLDLWNEEKFQYKLLLNETSDIDQFIKKHEHQYRVYGREAFKPGDGGDGGIGGIGGYSGQSIFYGFGMSPKFAIFNKAGKMYLFVSAIEQFRRLNSYFVISREIPDYERIPLTFQHASLFRVNSN